MNWSTILTTVLPEVITLFSKTTAPVAAPVTPGLPPTVSVLQKPSEAVKAIQTIIKQFVPGYQDLAVDGWLGPKTEAAIMQGSTLIQSFLGAGRAL